ncbi:MAG: sigma 54-interacting transcriptional regulator [Velocimicrobium sp.]
MSGIALLLPREHMAQEARALVEREGYRIDEIKSIKTANSVSEARMAVAKGASIIIARGYQALMIKRYTNVTVIDIILTGQELGLLVMKAKKLVKKENPKIALVGFSNMFSNTNYFNQLFQVELITYLGDTEEKIQTAADQAIADKVDVIIGGDTVIMAAKEAEISSLFLEATEDSIREAIQIAQKAAYAANVEKKHNAQMEAMLDNSFSGIVRLNIAGEIINANRIIEKLFLLNKSELIGKKISEVIEGIDERKVQSVLCGEDEIYSSFIRIKETAVVFMLAAVSIEGVIDGAIFSCNIVKKPEQKEAETMREMYLHGFVAKGNFHNLLYKSKKMHECVELAKIYAMSNRSILIYGEVGTEKERMAEAIHNTSLRKSSPFISINCNDLTEEMQEKILFGAFEEADSDENKLGALGTAKHGTVLLGEIERLGKRMQYKLYRAIKDQILTKNDIEKAMTLDTRIIATTNANLYEMVKMETFREDLYYLLNGLCITIPPLRSRPEDLEKLIYQEMKKVLDKYSRYHVLTTAAKDVLLRYYWSGNLVQVESFMDRMILTAKRRSIDADYVEKLLADLYPLIQTVDGEEKKVIYKNPKAQELIKTLEKHGGDRALVAKELGISKTTLWRHMKKYGITGTFDV